jgi:hypothetical protein
MRISMSEVRAPSLLQWRFEQVIPTEPNKVKINKWASKNWSMYTKEKVFLLEF